jgi:hypothetical protein
MRLFTTTRFINSDSIINIMIELKGLEKLTFTNGEYSPSVQFTKKVVQVAQDRFKKSDYVGVTSNIFGNEENIYCFGVRNGFEILDLSNSLIISDKGYMGEKLVQEDVENLFGRVIEELTTGYGISKIEYK